MLPTLKNLRPKWPNRKTVEQKDAGEKAKQAFYYNRRHGARPLPPLRPGDAVFAKLDQEKTWVTPAVVSKESVTPRSSTHHTSSTHHKGVGGVTAEPPPSPGRSVFMMCARHPSCIRCECRGDLPICKFRHPRDCFF